MVHAVRKNIQSSVKGKESGDVAILDSRWRKPMMKVNLPRQFKKARESPNI